MGVIGAAPVSDVRVVLKEVGKAVLAIFVIILRVTWL